MLLLSRKVRDVIECHETAASDCQLANGWPSTMNPQPPMCNSQAQPPMITRQPPTADAQPMASWRLWALSQECSWQAGGGMESAGQPTAGLSRFPIPLNSRPHKLVVIDVGIKKGHRATICKPPVVQPALSFAPIGTLRSESQMHHGASMFGYSPTQP